MEAGSGYVWLWLNGARIRPAAEWIWPGFSGKLSGGICLSLGRRTLALNGSVYAVSVRFDREQGIRDATGVYVCTKYRRHSQLTQILSYTRLLMTR